MASALSKEIEMMEAQLNRCKELACEAIFLRDESRSLTVLLNEKVFSSYFKLDYVITKKVSLV